MNVDVISAEAPAFLAGLEDKQRAWVLDDLRLRAVAAAFAARHNRDEKGIYRTLQNLRRSPEQRLALGLRHARLHPDRR